MFKKKVPLRYIALLAILQLILFAGNVTGGLKQNYRLQGPEWPVTFDRPNSALIYHTDQFGAYILDFSYAGYMHGSTAIPDVPAVFYIEPGGTMDDGSIIQYAIDQLSSMPVDRNGIRGAILLAEGTFLIPGNLKINTSGIILRGSGSEIGGTVLKATGVGRRTLIEVSGINDRELLDDRKVIQKQKFIPAGSMDIALSMPHLLEVGDRIVIHVPSTPEWISKMGMDRFRISRAFRANWHPGSADLYLDRTVAAIEKQNITLDAPVPVPLDPILNPATIYPYSFPGRIQQVGIENLRCISEFDEGHPKDEEHSWIAMTFDNVEHAWVRNVVTQHFTGSAVTILPEGKNISVMDVKALDPVGENGGYRRRSFFTLGQMSLFFRCHSSDGRNDFVSGHTASGPGAFVDCHADNSSGDSGPIESWSTGMLWDNVFIDGGGLRAVNRGQKDMGAGWSGGNNVFWNSTASIVESEHSPVASNWALGCFGELHGEGVIPLDPTATPANLWPQSLYRQQVEERSGVLSLYHFKPSEISKDRSNAQVINHKSVGKILNEIDKSDENTIYPISIKNGWLQIDGRYLSGPHTRLVWWQGKLAPGLRKLPGITRFVPGRYGLNFTDDLHELTDSFEEYSFTVHTHGLWYDRRRDDHQIVRRMDGDVVPPFYEYPWARSGHGTAWDGLGKFDLSRFNPWYFRRLSDFADLAGQKKQVLVNYFYLQHNLLEAGAHWADFPWRPANNIQGDALGIPEPPPYAYQSGNNKPRIFAAEFFYDVSHPVRAELHKKYIRHSLDNFSADANVIHVACKQFTGPLEFIQFWYDEVIQWKKETGKRVYTLLEATRDVQDAILEDTKRGHHVDIISLKFWLYRSDGSVYGQKGGEQETFRQFSGRVPLPEYDPFLVYSQIREYRERYPDKAVMFHAHPDVDPWVVAMAGGSGARIDGPENLMKIIPFLQPVDLSAVDGKRVLGLANQNFSQLIVYDAVGGSLSLDLTDIPEWKGRAGDYGIRIIDPESGQSSETETLPGGKIVSISSSDRTGTPKIYWLSRSAYQK